MGEYTSPDGKYVWNGDAWIPIGSDLFESNVSTISDSVEKKILENENRKSIIKAQIREREKSDLIERQAFLNPFIQTLKQKISEIIDNKNPSEFELHWEERFQSDIFIMENTNKTKPYFLITFRTRIQSDPSKLKQRTPPPWHKGPSSTAWSEFFQISDLRKLQRYTYNKLLKTRQ